MRIIAARLIGIFLLPGLLVDPALAHGLTDDPSLAFAANPKAPRDEMLEQALTPIVLSSLNVGPAAARVKALEIDRPASRGWRSPDATVPTALSRRDSLFWWGRRVGEAAYFVPILNLFFHRRWVNAGLAREVPYANQILTAAHLGAAALLLAGAPWLAIGFWAVSTAYVFSRAHADQSTSQYLMLGTVGTALGLVLGQGLIQAVSAVGHGPSGVLAAAAAAAAAFAAHTVLHLIFDAAMLTVQSILDGAGLSSDGLTLASLEGAPGRRMVLTLTPQWAARKRQGSLGKELGFVEPLLLQALAEEFAFWPRVTLGQIAIEDRPDLFVDVSASQNRIVIARSMVERPETLQFALRSALAQLDLEQDEARKRSDVSRQEDIAGLWNDIRELGKGSFGRLLSVLPFSRLLRAGALRGPAVREVLLIRAWLGDLETRPVEEQEVILAGFGDHPIGSLLRRLRNQAPEVQRIEAALWVADRTRQPFPVFMGETWPEDVMEKLLSVRPSAQDVPNLEGLKEIDEDYDEVIKKLVADSGHKNLAELRSGLLLAQIVLEENTTGLRAAANNFNALRRLVGAELFDSLRRWNGAEFGEFIYSITPEMMGLLEWMSPAARATYMRSGFPKLRADIKELEGISPEKLTSMLDSLSTMFGRPGLEALIQGNVGTLMVSLLRANRRPMALQALLSNTRAFARQTGFHLESASPDQIIRLITCNGLLTYGQVQSAKFDPSDFNKITGWNKFYRLLAAQLGDEFVARMARQDPISLLETISWLRVGHLTKADLDQLRTAFGTEKLRGLWSAQPSYFALGLHRLHTVDPAWLALVGPEDFYREVCASVIQFEGRWRHWFQFSANTDSISESGIAFARNYDLNRQKQFEFGNVAAMFQRYLSCVPAEWVVKTLHENPQRAANFVRVVGLLTHPQWSRPARFGLDISNDDPHSIWHELVALLGADSINRLLRDCPDEFIAFLGIIANHPQKSIESLRALSDGLGKQVVCAWIAKDPQYMAYWAVPMDKITSQLNARRMQTAQAIWGRDLRNHLEAFKIIKLNMGSIKTREDRLLAYVFGSAKRQSFDDVLIEKQVSLPLGLNQSLLREAARRDFVAVQALYDTPGWDTVWNHAAELVGASHLARALVADPAGLAKVLSSFSLDKNDILEVQRGLGIDSETFGQLFEQSPEEMVRMARVWAHAKPEQRHAWLNARTAWGEAGNQLWDLALRHGHTTSQLLELGLQVVPSTNLADFLSARWLPSIRAGFSLSSRQGWRVEDHMVEANLAMELAQRQLGISMAAGFELWPWIFDRTWLPFDHPESWAPTTAFAQDPIRLQALKGALLSAPLGSAELDRAAGLAVQMPEAFKGFLSSCPPERRQYLQHRLPTLYVGRLFDALRYSASGKGRLNFLMGHLFQEVIDGRSPETRVLGAPTPWSETAVGRDAEKKYPMFHPDSLRTPLRLLGAKAPDSKAFCQAVSPALLIQMLMYNVDTLHNEAMAAGMRQRIVFWLEHDPAMQTYLTDTVRRGLLERHRFEADYQNALRALLFVPAAARVAIAHIYESLGPAERAWLAADAVNAAADNRLNRIISSHAELSRHESMGLGLIPLASKLSDPLLTTPLSTLDLQEVLASVSLEMTSAQVEARLDPFRFGSWHGMVIPRLSILQSGYRGARAFDDPTARYITRAFPVAVIYSWKGGERAEGEGERVVHEWSFPALSEQVADLDVGREADIQLGEIDYRKLRVRALRGESVIEGAVSVQKDAQGNFILGIWKGKLVLVYIHYDLFAEKVTESLMGEYEIPVEGEFRLVTLPPKTADDRPMVFQVGRRGAHLFVLMVDRNVALANHLTQAPGPEAYVRKVSTEGLPDLEIARRMGRIQVAERQLRNELLNAVDVLRGSRDGSDALWGLRTIRAALSDLDPTVSSDTQAIEVKLEPPYFNAIYGGLKALMASQGSDAEMEQKLADPKERRRLLRSMERALRRLRKQQDLLQGTFEAPEWEFAVDPYRGEVHNRRTLANRFIEMLRRHPRPSQKIREMYAKSELTYFLKEFTRLTGVAQSSRLHAGVMADEHTLRVVEEMDKLIAKTRGIARPEELRLLALFHDIGKAEGGRGHAARSVDALNTFLASVDAPASIVARLGMLVQNHLELGMITLTDVHRIAEGRKAVLSEPGYIANKQARVNELAKILSDGYPLKQALDNLEDLYRLTIADSSAHPFPQGDTGNRYTTLFARELKRTKNQTADAIRARYTPVSNPPGRLPPIAA